MSLLRRREMMQSKQQEENLIYVYSGYIGFVSHMGGVESYDSIKIIKTDGTEIDYKIIDMRGD